METSRSDLQPVDMYWCVCVKATLCSSFQLNIARFAKHKVSVLAVHICSLLPCSLDLLLG